MYTFYLFWKVSNYWMSNWLFDDCIKNFAECKNLKKFTLIIDNCSTLTGDGEKNCINFNNLEIFQLNYCLLDIDHTLILKNLKYCNKNVIELDISKNCKLTNKTLDYILLIKNLIIIKIKNFIDNVQLKIIEIYGHCEI